MRLLVLSACAVCLLMPGLVFAAPYATIPAGTISVNNTAGNAVNGSYLDDYDWAAIDTSSQVMDFTYIGQARITGSITNMTGEIISGWPGTWGSVGLVERAWINGDYVNLAGFSAWPSSYKAGWIQNGGMAFYVNPYGTYEDQGMKTIIQGSNQAVEHFYDPHVFTSAQIDFKIYYDMTDFNTADPSAGGLGTLWADYNDPAEPEIGWYSEENNGDLVPPDGVAAGRRHGDWAADDPMWYDDWSDVVMGISLVEDVTGHSGSYTFTDINLDVVGRLPGDINLDGTVNDIDATILATNWGSTNATWTSGDCGGGTGWGGLDGVVDAADSAVLASHWLESIAIGTSAVPEPSTLILLGLGCLVLFVRKNLRK